MNPAPPVPLKGHKPFTRMQAIGLVFICTLLGAAAQVLMKIGANHMQGGLVELLLRDPIQVIGNFPLIIGYSFYGINTLLLMLALRDGELSVLYPVIALTYVWVTVLSVHFFQEELTLWKVAGISAIMGGVVVLGRAGSRP